MPNSKPSSSSIQPMVDMFASILTRLDALEAGGIAPSSSDIAAIKASAKAVIAEQTGASASTGAGDEADCVKAYDEYVKSYVVPLSKSCDELDGKLKQMGQYILDAWDSIRGIIILASRSKKPDEQVGVALQPYLEKTQTAMKNINSLRLDRDYDRHYKGMTEMIACCSWVLMTEKPANFVKETLGASEFWLNRIRKDFKNKDMKQIAFCDNVKTALVELAKYIENFHKDALSWNSNGIPLADTAVALLGDQPLIPAAAVAPSAPKVNKTPIVSGGGGASAFMSELSKKRTAAGDSAALGLKKVSKDQQTWRSEFKGDAPVVSKKKPLPFPVKKKVTAAAPKKVLPPRFEYEDRSHRWFIEHQTEQSVKENFDDAGMIIVNITDPKQQVYLYKCTGITVKVISKFKSVVIENCTKCGVIFESVLACVEVLNSKRVQVQTSGVCPVFTIDKTNGCQIYLSEESKSVSSFVTSESSEMNISFPDGDEQKELPIPQQFVHSLKNGKVTSEVSSLYGNC